MPTPSTPQVDSAHSAPPKNFGWTVEYQTPNGDWHLAYAGRHWKTEAGANKALDRYRDDSAEFGWKPAMRVIELVKSYNFVAIARATPTPA
jgi:hypothetical protein